MTDEDPIIEEIHRIRRQHAEQFDYDPDAIFRDIKAKEQAAMAAGVKFISMPPRRISAPLPIQTDGSVSASSGNQTTSSQ